MVDTVYMSKEPEPPRTPQPSFIAPGASVPFEGSPRKPKDKRLISRMRAWFRKPPGRHDSYVSNVTNPEDRRYIPRE